MSCTSDIQTPHKFLVINSIDRDFQSGSAAQFNLHLPMGIKFSYAELISFRIPNTFYNITLSNNRVNVDDTNYDITPGCYNLDELFSALVNLVPSFQSISYNDITGKVTITATGSITIDFTTGGQLNRVLGFPDNYIATGTSFVSTNPPFLAYYQMYIEVDRLSSNFMTSNNNYRSPTFIIDNNANKNIMIIYTQNSQYEQKIFMQDNQTMLHDLSITLKDNFGQVLQQCPEWNMTLKLF
jgi:hypothetical protein